MTNREGHWIINILMAVRGSKERIIKPPISAGISCPRVYMNWAEILKQRFCLREKKTNLVFEIPDVEFRFPFNPFKTWGYIVIKLNLYYTWMIFIFPLCNKILQIIGIFDISTHLPYKNLIQYKESNLKKYAFWLCSPEITAVICYSHPLP